ncbi:MAG: glycosyl transferase group 1 [Gemmatimonadetes bacterium]|nr:glycosyl transferase group 1 [Gemmatimonadota bacterium]
MLHGGVDRSGEERVIPVFLWLLERLARSHEIHVFAFNQEPAPASWTLHGCRVHNCGSEAGWRRRLLAMFAVEHRESPFRIVNGFFSWGGLWGAILAWRHRVPFLFHATGGEFVALDDCAYGMQRDIRGRLEVRIATRRARVVTVATEYMQHLATSRGVSARRVPLGVAIDEWTLSPPRARDVSQPFRLVHVADLRPVKDQAMLLAAFKILSEQGVACELDIAGHDLMNGALQQLVQSNASIRWHGRLGRTELRALMERADMLVVTSRHEAEPLVVLEAAIAGLPTIGTPVGHVADWSPDASVAVPFGNARALASAIHDLMHDDPRRMRLAGEAQKRAVAMDADVSAAAFDRLYREIAL